MAFSADELGRRAAALNKSRAQEQRPPEEAQQAKEVREYLRAFVGYVASLGVSPLPVLLQEYSGQPAFTEGYFWKRSNRMHPRPEEKYDVYSPVGEAYTLTHHYDHGIGSGGEYVGACVSTDLRIYHEAPVLLRCMTARYYSIERGVKSAPAELQCYLVSDSDYTLAQTDFALARTHSWIEEVVVQSAAAYESGNPPRGPSYTIG